MAELTPGGNQQLPDGALTLRVTGPYDVSALVTGDERTVESDADFVFFNQPSAPGVEVSPGAAADTVRIDPRKLRPGASRVTLALSPAEPGVPLGGLPAPVLTVLGPGEPPPTVATFHPPPAATETVLLLAEVYRRGTGWKIRALGQGYAEGLAGLARDFGVDVEEDEDGAGGEGAGTGAGTPERADGGIPAPPRRPPAYVPTLTDLRVPPPAAGPEEYAALAPAARDAAQAPPVALDLMDDARPALVLDEAALAA
ncbi:TerD family protein, partial [Streptomyces tremellae]|uniref:TerD family protein n=1 Tax=Streptomyces tremellae TaxID=1124239 RepID=UPI0031EA5C80